MLSGLLVILLSSNPEPVAQPPVSEAKMRESIQKSLPYIEERGQWWIRSKKCVSCHRLGNMVWTLSEARKAGFQVSDKLDQWIEYSINRSAEKNDKGKLNGATNKEGVAQLLVAAFSSVESKEQNQLRSILTKGQQSNGLWRPGGQLPKQKRPSKETTEVASMWIALALQTEDPKSPIAQKLVENTVKTVSQSSARKSVEWYALRALLAKSRMNKKQVSQTTSQLTKMQKDDGGWAWVDGDDSDALATGIAIYALAKTGTKSDHKTIQGGVRFLLSTQTPLGNWKVHGTKANARKRVQETSTYWGTTWAALGLIANLPQAQK